MIPDAENAAPATANDIRCLIARTGKPSVWCARRIGVTDGYLRKLTAGSRQASYAVTFALESLAVEMERIRAAANQLSAMSPRRHKG